MKGLIGILLAVIFITGCTGGITGKATEATDELAEPKDLAAREIAILTLTKKTVEPYGLPVFVPAIGNEGETSEQIIQRVFKNGLNWDDVYFGIKVYLPKLESDDAVKAEYERIVKNTIKELYLKETGQDISTRANYDLIVQKALLTPANLEKLQGAKYVLAEDAIMRYTQFLKTWPTIRNKVAN